MKRKPFGILRQFISYHKDGCLMIEPYGECSCGRDESVKDLELIDRAVDILGKLNGYLNDGLYPERGSQAHREISELMEEIGRS